jgi:hypothetical protein
MAFLCISTLFLQWIFKIGQIGHNRFLYYIFLLIATNSLLEQPVHSNTSQDTFIYCTYRQMTNLNNALLWSTTVFSSMVKHQQEHTAASFKEDDKSSTQNQKCSNQRAGSLPTFFFKLGTMFHPEDRNREFLRNVATYRPSYTA